MEVWTDGTLVVHACEKTSAVRVLRDFAVFGEARAEHDLGWKTPLAVDVEADRIWAGNRLQEFRLSDVSPVATHEDRVWRLAGLGGGRLAAILPPVDGVCRLAVGKPGDWEHEVVLDDLGEAAPGLAMTDERPVSHAVGGDPTLTATGHGLVVADGQRGVVAHFSPDLELLGLWHAGGVDETELTGYAAARGVLVTARWAGRDSRVGWLTSEGPRHLRDSYGAYAMPAGDDQLWLVGNLEVALLEHTGEPIATARSPHHLIKAAHASDQWCVMGTTAAVGIAAADEGVLVRTVGVGGIVGVIAIFDRRVDLSDVEIWRYSMSHGYSTHKGDDNRQHVIVGEVRPGGERDLEQVLRAAGAISVEILEPVRDRPCCS
ncbi:hypothetical protein [Nonomuraea sp. NPDC050786]|uniref:hypothetical protein n=1 Tax=Nonomuraea sp. NPDC050786 TaxID=3154840 RepID=UPI0033CF47CA